MLVYELYTFSETKGYELIAVPPERRKNPARITKDSVMNWARLFSGDHGDRQSIFFKPVRIDGNDH